MLEQLRITGLGVIDEAVIELSPGLTVVTGETGAGKTMVMTGLAWLFGQRADSGAVRPGCPTAVVEGVLRVPVDGPAAERATDAGAELDPSEDDQQALLVLARSVMATGRSRAHVGGRSVPVAVLSDLAEHALAVHGQSDQQLLVRPSAQRRSVDRYAGAAAAEALALLRDSWARWRVAEQTLTGIVAARREREQEAALLRLGLTEVEQLAPQPGEDHALLAESERLGHADTLRAAAATAHARLAGDPDDPAGGADVLAALASAGDSLQAAGGHDPALTALAGRLREAGYLVADVAAELAGYADTVDADPPRLAAVQQRRAELAGLVRRYGDDIDDVLEWASTGALRLAELAGDDETVERLTSEVGRLRDEVTGHAAALTSIRRAAAVRLAEQVGDELAGLAMPHARLEVSVRPRPAGDGPTVVVDGLEVGVGPEGADEVELLLAPHPGAPARPLGKGASGGELSRVMLALEVALAATDPVPLMVFDEVDAGVGGQAAVEVGRRLARLSVGRQVLVVTHLPQVAAWADTHLAVRKTDDGLVTRSGVTVLDDQQRVAELARMLAGHGDSDAALTHADELVAEARRHRARPAAASDPGGSGEAVAAGRRSQARTR